MYRFTKTKIAYLTTSAFFTLSVRYQDRSGVGSENEINVFFSGPTHPSEKLAVRKQALRRVAWYGCDAGSMGLISVEKNAFLCKKILVMSMFQIGEFKVKYIA
jgi:hypothetical protein